MRGAVALARWEDYGNKRMVDEGQTKVRIIMKDIKYPEEIKEEAIKRVLHLYHLDNHSPKRLLRSEQTIPDNDTRKP